MHNNPPTPLFRHILIPILRIHMFLTKITILIFEPSIIHRDQLTKYLAFYLLDKIVDCISIYKMTFFGIMGV